MKCPYCGGETYRSQGDEEICRSCGRAVEPTQSVSGSPVGVETRTPGSGKPSMSKLDTLAAVVLAAEAGAVAVALGMRIGLGSGGIFPLLLFLFVAVNGYRYGAKLVTKFAWLRWPILAAFVVGVVGAAIAFNNSGGRLW